MQRRELAWRTKTRMARPSYSPSRWWSHFEVIHQLLKQFGDLRGFLEECDLPCGTSKRLLEILNDDAKMRKLKMEITITVDALESFVKCTYDLEGDGALVLITYERIQALFHHISLEHYLNVNAVAKDLSADNTSHEVQLITYAKNYVAPAYAYFQEKFDNDLKPVLEIFSAACYCSPSKIKEFNPTLLDLESLKVFPFFGDSILVKVAVHPRGPHKHCVISLRTYSTRNPRVRLGTK